MSIEQNTSYKGDRSIRYVGSELCLVSKLESFHLDRRARYRSVGTEDAAIASFRPQPFATGIAVVADLAGVGRHLLALFVLARRAGDYRVFDDVGQGLCALVRL